MQMINEIIERKRTWGKKVETNQDKEKDSESE